VKSRIASGSVRTSKSLFAANVLDPVLEALAAIAASSSFAAESSSPLAPSDPPGTFAMCSARGAVCGRRYGAERRPWADPLAVNCAEHSDWI